MELRIEPYTKASPIVWNFEEIRTELNTKLETYRHLQFTPEQITDAKADRAALNNLKKALNNERIRREKEFLEPFNEFKSQIKELCDLIDEPVALIDTQIKEVENREKEEKKSKCIEIFNNTENIPEWLEFDRIFNEKWLNKTASEKSIRDEITDKVAKINADIKVLSELEYSFEAIEEYKRSLDISAAMSEGKRQAEIQAKKKQAEERTETPQIPFASDGVIEITADESEAKETAMWVKFEALLTRSQAIELKNFLNYNKIQFKAIKEDN